MTSYVLSKFFNMKQKTKYKFSEWKAEGWKLDSSKFHVSMDGETNTVIVKLLKTE